MKKSNQLEQSSQQDDLEDSLKREGEALKDKAGELKDKAKEKAREVKDKATDKIDDTWEEVKSKTSDAHTCVVDYVKKNPLKALGWAALAGVVSGILMRK